MAFVIGCISHCGRTPQESTSVNFKFLWDRETFSLSRVKKGTNLQVYSSRVIAQFLETERGRPTTYECGNWDVRGKRPLLIGREANWR